MRTPGKRRVAGVRYAAVPTLTGEASHDLGDELVQVLVLGGLLLEVVDADLVERLVVDAAGNVRVLDENVGGENGVVGLDDGLGNLGRGEHGERAEHAVGVLLADLAEQKSAETRTGTAAERVEELEALERVRALDLLAEDVEDGVDELGT